MSADRWSGCPRCFERGEAEQQERLDRLAEGDGMLSHEEYFDLKQAIIDYEPIDMTDEGTFAQYYEFYIRDNVVHADWSGVCRTCGFDVSFHHEHPFDTGVK